MQDLDGIEREIGANIDLSLIWLHGLGADASDFLPIVGELELRTGVRFVFPNAPSRAVTINGGMVMRAWYDITGFGQDVVEDVDGLMQSIATVRALVQREIDRGISARRIVLAGFSQGGAVVLHAGLTHPERLGGIVGLSTYLPAAGLLGDSGTIQTEIPILLAHGTHDPVIPIALAEQSVEFIKQFGLSIDWLTYPMAHQVCMEEIQALSTWLRQLESR